MILKWYNRDEFSDRDMAQAKAVSNRLQGKKDAVEPWGWEPAPQWPPDAKDEDFK
jgi:hypothetical protein